MRRKTRVLILIALMVFMLACNAFRTPTPIPFATIAPTDVPATATPENIAEEPTATPEAEADIPNGIYAYQSNIHPDLPPYSFTLTGEQNNDMSSHIDGIVVIPFGQDEPSQRIEGLDATIFAQDEMQGFVVEDLNFDGYADIRLMEFIPAGPNVPYLYWLFDATTQQFVANEALRVLASPAVNNDAQELYSPWRDGATVEGTDTYIWQGDALVLIRRETRSYRDAGVYTLTIETLVDGQLVLTSERLVNENEADDPMKIRFETGAISGQVIGMLDEAREHSYHLWAAQDQLMLVQIEALDGNQDVWLTVDNADGIVHPVAGQGISMWTTWLVRLPQSGEYNLNVQSYLPDIRYRMTVTIVTVNPQVTSLPAVSTGRLTGTGLDVYQFNAEAGQTLSLIQNNDKGLFAVMGADGTVFDTFYFPRALQWSGQLPSTQAYWLIVASKGEDYAYGFDLQLSAAPESTILDACPDATATSLPYISVDGGYCLLYPEGFAVDESPVGTVRLHGRFPEASLEPVSAWLVVEPMGAANGQSAAELANAALAQSGGELGGEISIGGEIAVVLAQVPGRLLSTEAYVVHNDAAYTLWLNPSEFEGMVGEEADLLWETVTSSLTFID